jgi:hypothetical protein
MRQALGSDRVVGVEVWEIRTEKVTVISNDKADAHEANIREVFQRMSLGETEEPPESTRPTLW